MNDSASPTRFPHPSLNRRAFSKLLATAALGTVTAPAFLRGQNLNGKLNVAVIGVGGRGASNIAEVGKTENIVAICDVAETALDSAQRKFPQAERFTDFRKVFEKEKDVRCRGGEHLRAHARLRHAAGAAIGQACLLRKAAHAQHLGSPRDSRSGGQGQSRHANGHSDSRERQLSPRGRADSSAARSGRCAKFTSGWGAPGAGNRRKSGQGIATSSS